MEVEKKKGWVWWMILGTFLVYATLAMPRGGGKGVEKIALGWGWDWPLTKTGLRKPLDPGGPVYDDRGYAVDFRSAELPIAEESLLGTWHGVDAGPPTFEGDVTYMRGGAMMASGNFTDGSTSIFLSTSGSWRLEGTLLRQTMASSNRPDLVAPNTEVTSTVLSVSREKLKTQDVDGKVDESTRVGG